MIDQLEDGADAGLLLREMRQAQAILRQQVAQKQYQAHYADVPWARWLVDMFPNHFLPTHGDFVPFAPFHQEVWEWVLGINANERPNPFVGIWARDTGKSTNAETVCCYLGGEGLRSYALYVCGTQHQADDHCQNIAAQLTSRHYAERYPLMAERSLTKFGQSQGWRTERVRTAAGFVIDAIGLDKAVRGARIEDMRPDLIIFDDIDNTTDSPRLVEKKVDAITKAILPAGDRNKVAVLFMQNLIHDNSVAAQLVDGKADFMRDNILSGPYPAVRDMEYRHLDGKATIVAGTPTWAGFGIKQCQSTIDTIGLRAFMKEHQHQRADHEGALWTPELIDRGRVDVAPDLRRVLVGVDPQASNSPTGSSTGMVVGGRSQDNHCYVQQDESGFMSVDEWTRKSVELYHAHKADAIVAEINNGGDMVIAAIHAVDPNVRVIRVRATRGKYTRAEPIVAFYEQGLVHHVGYFQKLEEEMCSPYDPDSIEVTWDRMDGLVWMLTELLLPTSDELPHLDPSNHRPARRRVRPNVAARRAEAHLTPEEWKERLNKLHLGEPLEMKTRNEYVMVARPALVEFCEDMRARGEMGRLQMGLDQIKKLDTDYSVRPHQISKV